MLLVHGGHLNRNLLAGLIEFLHQLVQLLHQLNTIAAPIGLVNRVIPLATLDILDLFQRLLDTVNVHDGIDSANT